MEKAVDVWGRGRGRSCLGRLGLGHGGDFGRFLLLPFLGLCLLVCCVGPVAVVRVMMGVARRLMIRVKIMMVMMMMIIMIICCFLSSAAG